MNRHVSDAPAEALAARIAELLRISDPEAPFALGFSGGSTPVPLFRTLSQMHDLPWARMQVFLVDERFVGLDASESNWRQLREALLDHVPIPECNVFPVPTHLDTPEQAAAAYEATLRSTLGPSPAWDVAVMGMGDDGHTASLFPGSAFDTEKLVAHALAPPTSPVEDRITATLPFLQQAKHVLFLVIGAKKHDLVQRVFDEKADACPEIPAACVRGTEETTWFLDRDAGA